MLICQQKFVKAHHSAGFTLVEALVTVAIMAIVLSVAIPSFNNTLANQRIKDATATISDALKQAKSENYIRRGTVRLNYSAAESTLAIEVPDPDFAGIGDPDFEDLVTFTLPSSSDITVANTTPDPIVTFRNGGNRVDEVTTYTICDDGVTGETARQVIVDTVANISIQVAGSC